VPSHHPDRKDVFLDLTLPDTSSTNFYTVRDHWHVQIRSKLAGLYALT